MFIVLYPIIFVYFIYICCYFIYFYSDSCFLNPGHLNAIHVFSKTTELEVVQILQ